jgi:hypothetical protein
MYFPVSLEAAIIVNQCHVVKMQKLLTSSSLLDLLPDMSLLTCCVPVEVVGVMANLLSGVR